MTNTSHHLRASAPPWRLAPLLLGLLGCSAPAPDVADGGPDAAVPGCVGSPYGAEAGIERLPAPRGVYPECPEGLPQGRVRIESVTSWFLKPKDESRLASTSLVVTALSLAEPCTARLVIRLDGEVIAFKEGSVVRLDSRSITRPDLEVSLDFIVRDEGGTVLFAYAQNRPLAELDEALYGLRLGKEPDLLCRWPQGTGALRIHLEADGHECALAAGTGRCCPLWGGAPYDGLLGHAGYIPGQPPTTSVTFQIRKKGLIRSADDGSESSACR